MSSLLLYYTMCCQTSLRSASKFLRQIQMKTSLKGKAAWLGKRMSVQKTTAPAQPSNRLTGWSGSLGKIFITGSKMNIYTATQHYRQAVHLAERNWSLNRNSANLMAR